MNIYTKKAIQQINSTISHCRELRSNAEKNSPFLNDVIKVELLTTLSSNINHLSPPNSVYRNQVAYFNKVFHSNWTYALNGLMGLLNSLKHDFQYGNLKTFHEMVHADVFVNFLEMAEYILREGYKDAAAVIIGGTLEQHLRNLCLKNSIPVVTDKNKPLNLSAMNEALEKKSVYSKTDKMNILAWLILRNSAAHGNYKEYDKEHVSQMLKGVKDFIFRNPA